MSSSQLTNSLHHFSEDTKYTKYTNQWFLQGLYYPFWILWFVGYRDDHHDRLDSLQGNHETKQMMEKYNGALSGLEAIENGHL